MAVTEQLGVSNNLQCLSLGEGAMMVWVKLGDELPENLTMTVNNVAEIIISGFMQTKESVYAYSIFNSMRIKDNSDYVISLFKGEKLIGHITRANAVLLAEDYFLSMYNKLFDEDRRKLFHQFTCEAPQKLGIGKLPLVINICSKMRMVLPANYFHANAGLWLAPNVLFFQGVAEQQKPDGEPLIIVNTANHLEKIVSRYVQLSESQFAFVLIFSFDAAAAFGAQAMYTYFIDNNPVRVDFLAPEPANARMFTDYINSMPEYQRIALREIMCVSLIDLSLEDYRDAASDIINTLQLFTNVSITSCAEANKPFNIHFETIMPIDKDGVFTSGWMRDPFNMLESVIMHSPLGFSIPIHQDIFRTKRQDVLDAFRNSPYGNFTQDLGFVSYTQIPLQISSKLQNVADIKALSFTAHLKGGTKYDIQPEMSFRDDVAARDFVTKVLHTSVVSDEMLDKCFGPAASALQTKCMESVRVKSVHDYLKLPESPIVSIVIPLYQKYEYIKLHFASMASDPDIATSEIIYVLDSPWQEAEVRAMISEHAQLYRMPVKLVVMDKNVGYAAATNTGTTYARGEYVLLMNSDVFPVKRGWLGKMVDFYSKQKNIGALAPKLIYEDDSLQHAGMFFAKTSLPFWLNLHYYKGYANSFPAGSITRPVPAVTGACLMMRRSLWEEVGRLTTDYIIGDFEDSDLCLKCAAKGLENWYFADASLYHLERQSVPLNSSYNDSLAWRYNAKMHTQRWNGLIENLMDKYGEL